MPWAAAAFKPPRPSLSYSLRGWASRAEEGALLVEAKGGWPSDRHVWEVARFKQPCKSGCRFGLKPSSFKSQHLTTCPAVSLDSKRKGNEGRQGGNSCVLEGPHTCDQLPIKPHRKIPAFHKRTSQVLLSVTGACVGLRLSTRLKEQLLRMSSPERRELGAKQTLWPVLSPVSFSSLSEVCSNQRLLSHTAPL